MRVLPDTNEIWDRIYDKYGFQPLCTEESYTWLQPPVPFMVFALPEQCWNEEQEHLVNSFFIKLNTGNLYALDWQHDCFTYDPREEIPLNYQYRDEERDCNVYFPSYYPNGDYYFFGDMNGKNWLFGHPWLREIIVTGEDLIRLFEENARFLGIKRVEARQENV